MAKAAVATVKRIDLMGTPSLVTPYRETLLLVFQRFTGSEKSGQPNVTIPGAEGIARLAKKNGQFCSVRVS
jgi:hypothetical protein